MFLLSEKVAMFRLKSIFIFVVFIFISNFNLASDAIKIRTPVMDHESIYYFLKNLFGPQSKSIIKKNILLRPNLWGGPCDLYSQVFTSGKNGKIKLLNDEAECPDEGASSKTEYYLEKDVQSFVILDKTCVKLVDNKNTFDFFKNNLKIVDINEETVKLAYKAFFPNRTPSEAWVEKAKNENQLRTIVLSLCRTPTWQNL